MIQYSYGVNLEEEEEESHVGAQLESESKTRKQYMMFSIRALKPSAVNPGTTRTAQVDIESKS